MRYLRLQPCSVWKVNNHTHTVVSLSLLPSRGNFVKRTSEWNRQLPSAGHCPLQGRSKSKGLRGHWPLRFVSWSRRHLLSKHLRDVCVPAHLDNTEHSRATSIHARAGHLSSFPPSQASFPITVVLEGLFLKHRPTPALWVGF